MNRLVVTGKPQQSRLIFPPYTKHFFTVLLFEPSLSTAVQGKQGVQGAYALVRGGSCPFQT